MKVHDEIESLADVYLAGGLEAGERQAVEDHVADCNACAGVVRDATEFHGWVSGLSAPNAPAPGLEDRIIASLRMSTHRRAPKLIRLMVGVAAVFALIVIGGLFSDTAAPGMVVRMPLQAPTSARVDGNYTEFAKSGGFGGDSTAPTGWSTKPEYKDKNAEFFSRGDGRGAGEGERMRDAGESRRKADDERARPGITGGMEEDHNESADLEAEKKAGESLKNQEQGGKPQDPGAPPPDASKRKIIFNADLHLEVEKYDAAYTRIAEITRGKKGFIAGASTTRLANGKVRATVTLRIPPERFEETLAELGKLGTVRHQGITSSDVTKHYQDLEGRLDSKKTLVERLKKVLLEGKGTVKELMEVEVQMGATIEQIEAIKGELKYYDNLVGLSTITMQVFEKDLGVPFEYVQTLQSVITVRAIDADSAYAKAQQVIVDAGGQVVESRMTRANEESASGFVRGKVDSEKFPDVRAKLKALGQYVDQDTVNQQQTGRGGQGDTKPGAPVRKEQAVVDFTVNTPPVFVSRRASLTLESANARSVYETARQEIAAAKGKILGGTLNDRKDGVTASVVAQVEEKSFLALVEKLKSLGKVKASSVKQEEPGSEPVEAFLMRGELALEIVSPPPLIPEESGLGKVLRETFTGSVAGLLWSVEKLIVGIALAGPWILLALLVFVIWRRARRRKATQPAG